MSLIQYSLSSLILLGYGCGKSSSSSKSEGDTKSESFVISTPGKAITTIEAAITSVGGQGSLLSSAISPIVPASFRGNERSDLALLEEQTEVADPALPGCSNFGTPWANNASFDIIAKTGGLPNKEWAAKLFYCQLNTSEDGQSVRGSLRTVKAITCQTDKDGLTFETTPQEKTLKIAKGSGCLDDRMFPPNESEMTVYVRVQKPANGFSHKFEYKFEPQGTYSTMYINVTDKNISLISLEDSRTDRISPSFVTLDTTTGTLSSGAVFGQSNGEPANYDFRQNRLLVKGVFTKEGVFKSIESAQGLSVQLGRGIATLSGNSKTGIATQAYKLFGSYNGTDVTGLDYATVIRECLTAGAPTCTAASIDMPGAIGDIKSLARKAQEADIRTWYAAQTSPIVLTSVVDSLNP